MTQKIRINKFLSDSGITSRRKSEELILEGRVAVNDNLITTLSYKVDLEKDVVTLDGERIKPKRNIYLLLNKPKGYITTVSDERDRRTVLDLIRIKEKIYPVGRLDYDTTGLLFLTNDGEFTQLLTHPSNKVPREYEVKLDKPLDFNDSKKLTDKVILDGTPAKFLRVSFIKHNDRKLVSVLCEEGRNRFVKRMFSKFGYRVEELLRISYAEIKLDVPTGKYRHLTLKEIQTIKEKYSN
jgi:23S rRNA pseudouridine2605 synthase